MTSFFPYGEAELAYLSEREPKLGEAIARLGKLEKPCYDDLLQGLVQVILGQQISVKAQAAIWQRLQAALPDMSPQTILNAPDELYRQAGVSARKMGYIKGMAEQIQRGEISLTQIRHMDDQAALDTLCRFKGIGEWTAKILLVFALQRPNVFNEADLSIHCGLRMLHRHRAMTPRLLAKYRRLHAPYNSIAMFYLYEISDGKLPELVDLAKKRTEK